jgi:multisubunit Na+/H+ antiporter MnhC subunit
MINDVSQFFWICCIGIILVFIIGLYCLLVTSNLIRAIIALELLTKAITLFIILAGYVTGRTGLAQAIAVTVIVIEVVIIAVACGVVLCVFRHNKTIDVKLLRNIKG